MVKNLPAMQETQVQSPWRRGGYQLCPPFNPYQPWLSTPVLLPGKSDRGAWWATGSGVAKS